MFCVNAKGEVFDVASFAIKRTYCKLLNSIKLLGGRLIERQGGKLFNLFKSWPDTIIFLTRRVTTNNNIKKLFIDVTSAPLVIVFFS